MDLPTTTALVFDTRAERRGTPLSKSVVLPLRPPTHDGSIPTHQTWFVGSTSGSVGALYIDGILIVGVGASGRAWSVTNKTVVPLDLDPAGEVPVELRPLGRSISSGLNRDARVILESLRFARVEPAAGERIVLIDGLSPGGSLPSSFQEQTLRGELRSIVEALHALPRPTLLERLLGRQPARTGAALVLDCVREDAAPAGFTPWLRAQERRGLHLDWSGNESDNYPLKLSERDPPADPDCVRDALLQFVRKNDEIPSSSGEAWDFWLERLECGDVTGPGDRYHELITGEPQRGFWRDVERDELESHLEMRASAYADAGTPQAALYWSRVVTGTDVVARIEAALDTLVAIAIHEAPEDECVVVWHVFGGVSTTSGLLEIVALERVWS